MPAHRVRCHGPGYLPCGSLRHQDALSARKDMAPAALDFIAGVMASAQPF